MQHKALLAQKCASSTSLSIRHRLKTYGMYCTEPFGMSVRTILCEDLRHQHEPANAQHRCGIADD